MDNAIFSFSASNGQLPTIHICGERLHVVTCLYSYRTSTEIVNLHEEWVVVSGYLEGANDLRSFKYNFLTTELFEL